MMLPQIRASELSTRFKICARRAFGVDSLIQALKVDNSRLFIDYTNYNLTLMPLFDFPG